MTVSDDLTNIQNTLFSAKDEIEGLINYMEPKNKDCSLENVEAKVDRAIALCTKALLKRMEQLYG